MNKITKILFLAAFSLIGLTSCETYGPRDAGATELGPVMSGEWIGGVLTDVATGAVLDLGAAGTTEAHGVVGWTLKTYGATNDDPTKAWIQIRNWYGKTELANGARVKVNADKEALAFLPSSTISTITPYGGTVLNPKTPEDVFVNFKLISGQVIKDGQKTLSDHYTDKLVLVFEYACPFMVTNNVKQVKLEAWRDTQWPEDYGWPEE